MATHTGRTDLYTCTFCPKTFRCSSYMYSHRKNVHPQEYEQIRNINLVQKSAEINPSIDKELKRKIMR